METEKHNLEKSFVNQIEKEFAKGLIDIKLMTVGGLINSHELIQEYLEIDKAIQEGNCSPIPSDI